jgi:hypothetical protein
MVVLVIAVIVALVLLAVAVSWGHSPPGVRPSANTDEQQFPDSRAA